MKTIRSIAEIIAVATTIFLASCKEAKAAIIVPTYSMPAIGTLQKVSDSGAGSITRIIYFAWAYGTNGQAIAIGNIPVSYIPTTSPFASKALMDQFIAVQTISNVLYFIATNTSTSLDKSKGVLVEVDCRMVQDGQDSQDVFSYRNAIQLTENVSGTYSVPDLSGFSTSLASSIPFYVPAPFTWAHVEVGYKNNPYPFELDDLHWTNNPIASDGYLYFNAGDITNSSSSNGSLWMKISLFDNGRFQTFNGDGGKQIAPTPMVLGISNVISGSYQVIVKKRIVVIGTSTNVLVSVTKGDAGIGFILQSSTNLLTWSNVTGTNFVSATNDVQGAIPYSLPWPFTNTSTFFRTLLVTNAPPTY